MAGSSATAGVYLGTSFVSACVTDRTDAAIICRRAGFLPPSIVTPDLLWEDDA